MNSCFEIDAERQLTNAQTARSLVYSKQLVIRLCQDLLGCFRCAYLFWPPKSRRT